MNDDKDLMCSRFANRSDRVAGRLRDDPEFCLLWKDYTDCLAALAHWCRSKAAEAEARAEEYRNLVDELEEEIVDALGAEKPQRRD
jgi:hypothetical protein